MPSSQLFHEHPEMRLAEQQDDAAWADHDMHRDSGTPVDGECVVCIAFPEQPDDGE